MKQAGIPQRVLAVALVAAVALVVAPGTASASPPTVVTHVANGHTFSAGFAVINGSATDDGAVSDVQIALRNTTTGEWLQDGLGTWGAGYRRVSVELTAPGSASTEWSIDVGFLPPGTYGFHPIAVDDEATLTPPSGRPWRSFVVQAAGNESPLVLGDLPPGTSVPFGAVAPTGTASDDHGVAAVEIAVRDRDNGVWLTDLGTFASGFRWVAVDVDAPGSPTVTWAYDALLPVGRYGYFARAIDSDGAATAPADRTWNNFDVVDAGTGPAGYLTIQFGRSQWAHATDCVQSNRVFDLGQIAVYLADRGLAAQGTAAIGHISADPTVRKCPWKNEITASWNDLAELRDDFGWTFVGDSMPIYNANGDITKSRPKMNELDPAEQYRQSCGSLEVLEANGHTRGWGLFAYAGNQIDLAAQDDIVSNCYAFSRTYGTAVNSLDSMASPWFASTVSVPGGNCNDPAESCFDQHLTRPGWSSRHYLEREDLLTRLSPGAGTWHIIQFYRLVEGARLEVEGPDDGNYWDCTSPDPSHHWTSKDELYCADDFRWAIDNLDPGVNVVDAAFVADVVGRGNPGG